MFHFFVSFLIFMLSAMVPAMLGSDSLTPTGIASLLIDQDPELSRMAEETSQIYKMCMTCGEVATDLLYKSQYEWTRDLKDCKSSACLAERYRFRIEYLKEYLEWAREVEKRYYDNSENLLPCKRGW